MDSLGRTTCLTGTDTVGANYNGAAGTSVIAGVDGTVASVNTAIAAISNGTLTGLVPAAGLISTLAAAQAAEVTVKAANAAAVDALVTKLAANVAAGTATDGIVAGDTYVTKLAAIVTDATAFRGAAYVSADSTAVLTTKAGEAATALTAARAGVITTADKALVATYDAAVAAEASALAAKPAAIVKGNVVGGLQADATAAAALLAYAGSAKTAAAVYTDYVAGDAVTRANIDTAFAKSAYYATFKATVVKDAAYVDAVKAKLAAVDALDTNVSADASGDATQTVDTVVLTHTDTVAGSAATNTFITAALAKTAADALVTKAVAADADVAAVKVITDANKVASDATAKAGQAIADFNAGSTTAKAVAITAVTADPAVKESFYFAAKPTGIAADDHVIATFGAGDSIVLGSGYTYNSGALSTGNNNAAEFFLVKTDAGVQVVIENNVYGSAGVTPVAATGVSGADFAGIADNLTAITLTGVTLDHLSVANGVVSYV